MTEPNNPCSVDIKASNSNNVDSNNCQDCLCLEINFITSSSVDLLNEFLRNGAYEVSCSSGHKKNICLQDFDFSIHFERGCLALIDGHYRSSLLDFQSTLESFYLWFIALFTLDRDPEYKKTLKFLKGQSERLLGAFLELYWINFKKSPLIFPDQKFNLKNIKCAEFRNKFVHASYTASDKEAFAYAKMILKYIRELIAECKEKYNDNISKLTDAHIKELQDRNKSISPTMTALGGILSLAENGTIKDFTFGHRLEKLQEDKMFQQKKKVILWSKLD